MELFKLFAWINVSLAAFNLFLFFIRFIGRKSGNASTASVKKKLAMIIKTTRKIHPFTGFLLIVFGFTHGFLALGGFSLHTGTLVWIACILMPLTLILKKKGYRKWIFLHRSMDAVLWILLILHRVNPWLIY